MPVVSTYSPDGHTTITYTSYPQHTHRRSLRALVAPIVPGGVRGAAKKAEPSRLAATVRGSWGGLPVRRAKRVLLRVLHRRVLRPAKQVVLQGQGVVPTRRRRRPRLRPGRAAAAAARGDR
ncbi:unnamed protein product [Laminaria digitata]